MLSTWQINKTESTCSTQRHEQNMDTINKTRQRRQDPDRFTKSTTNTFPTNPATSVNDVETL